MKSKAQPISSFFYTKSFFFIQNLRLPVTIWFFKGFGKGLDCCIAFQDVTNQKGGGD